jgi:hypothetical protein
VALAVVVWPTRIVEAASETTIVVSTGVGGADVPRLQATSNALSATTVRAVRATDITEIARVMKRGGNVGGEIG